MASLFDACKAIPAHEVAEREGIILQRRGSRYWARCPFHEDRTPSLMFDDAGRWHCFSCGAGGDAVQFLKELYNISPLEAARRLAEEAGAQYDTPSAGDARRREFEKASVRAFDEWWRRACDTVAVYLREMDAWRTKYGPGSMFCEWGERYCEGMRNVERWEWLFHEYLCPDADPATWDEKEQKWIKDKRAAFALKLDFFRFYNKEVEELDEWLCAGRKGQDAGG